MKQLTLIRLLSISMLAFVPVLVKAQTTLSFTSRGDLSSSFRTATRENDRIGSRASFGIEVAYRVNENQAVITGLEYAIAGTDFKEYFIFPSDIDPILGIIDSTKITGAARHDFLAFPIGYRWYGAGQKWQFYGQVSLIPMTYLRTIDSQRIEGERRTTAGGRKPFIKDIHIASALGGGVERVFENGWTLGLQPTFRVHLNALSDGSLQERLWTAGLQLSIGRLLKTEPTK